MKNIFKFLQLSILLVLAAGCDKSSRDINLNITEVTTFYAPNDNIFVKLEPSGSASVGFEWEQAKAEDGTLVMYEVAFDKEGGDFSQPVYKMSSDGNGVQNKLTLSHKDLNRIANMAGIGSLETGKIKWTVLAYKGTNVKPSPVSRTIEVERPAGFAEIPNEIFITGSATEFGTDAANAQKLKFVEPGVFEIYTSLKEGEYNFISKNDGSGNSFYIDGSVLRENGEANSPAATEAVYRIRLDFNNAAVSMQEVKSLGYWFSPHNSILAELNYEGNGVFKAGNVPIEFKQEGWGRDERYKFRMTLMDGGNEIIEDWGSENRDNSRPDNNTPASWYRIFKYSPNQWDYTFKFQTEADMKNVDMIVYFSPNADYTHEIIIK